MESITNTLPAISILIVEDETTVLNLLGNILSRKFPGITLHRAVNGKKGLELFNAYLSDIVITDINMPEMDGVQMAGKIRAIKPDTKFIVLTGDTGRLVLQDSVEKGFEFDHYIVKPIGSQELFAAIEQCIGEIAHQT